VSRAWHKDGGAICLLVEDEDGTFDYDILGGPFYDKMDQSFMLLSNGNVHVDDDTSDDAL
jgi:hypothetical protein